MTKMYHRLDEEQFQPVLERMLATDRETVEALLKYIKMIPFTEMTKEQIKFEEIRRKLLKTKNQARTNKN